jgi:putative acetyltransferase
VVRAVRRAVRPGGRGGRPVGFAELEADGHIDRVYVSADHQGRGIGRALLAAVVAEARRLAIARLFTEASITARPFFESQGFVVLTPQVVTCCGAEFVNYRMARVLTEPSTAADRRGM